MLGFDPEWWVVSNNNSSYVNPPYFIKNKPAFFECSSPKNKLFKRKVECFAILLFLKKKTFTISLQNKWISLANSKMTKNSISSSPNGIVFMLVVLVIGTQSTFYQFPSLNTSDPKRHPISWDLPEPDWVCQIRNTYKMCTAVGGQDQN